MEPSSKTLPVAFGNYMLNHTSQVEYRKQTEVKQFLKVSNVAAAEAMDRIHRLGQHRPVHAIKLVVEDSIESRIVQVMISLSENK